jgi:hypothetical protein
MTGRLFRRPVAALLGLLLLAGCESGPTYPKSQLVKGLQDLLVEEQLTGSVHIVDSTVGVQVSHAGSLIQTPDGQLALGPEFDEVLRKVIVSLHRVLLSTDADVRFYVFLLSDPSTPGATLTMVRYLDDVKRANANMLDTPEIFARTIYDVNVTGPDAISLEDFLPSEIHLGDFLSWQLSRRIQARLGEALQGAGTVSVGRVGGQYENGEFVFTLDLTPADGEAVDEAVLEQAFRNSTEEIAKVLSSYQFEQFDAVRLVHPTTGRHMLLPKARLQLFK